MCGVVIMKFIVWIINDIHVEFNESDIHWEGCLHITRHILKEMIVFLVTAREVRSNMSNCNNVRIIPLHVISDFTFCKEREPPYVPQLFRCVGLVET